jgi:hypothetical protein
MATACIFSTKANAQLSLGGRIGLNMPMLTVGSLPNGVSNGFNTGLAIGAVGNYAINDKFSLQAEILYSQQGSKLTMGSDYSSVRYNYISIPLLAKYKFGQETMGGFVDGGLQLAYLASGSGETSIGGQTTTASITDYSGMNRMDVGLSLGVGGYYKLGPGELQLDIRYLLGFIATNKNNDPTVTNYTAEDNRVFSISLAYLFSMGK